MLEGAKNAPMNLTKIVLSAQVIQRKTEQASSMVLTSNHPEKALRRDAGLPHEQAAQHNGGVWDSD